MNNNPNNPNTTISTDKLHKARGIIKISKAVNKEKKINYRFYFDCLKPKSFFSGTTVY